VLKARLGMATYRTRIGTSKMSKKAKILLLIIASYLHKNLYTAKYFLSKDSSNALIECAVSSSICKNVLHLTKSAKNSLAICQRQPNRKYFVKSIE
jgi:hypothetical protein